MHVKPESPGHRRHIDPSGRDDVVTHETTRDRLLEPPAFEVEFGEIPLRIRPRRCGARRHFVIIQ
jgi:hypothetical protein